MDNTELDDWDPLSEHYHDQNSNSYNTGAGANLPAHMQPASHRKAENISHVLWVRPLTSRYTEESLNNIFSHYGKVTNVRIVYPRQGDKSPFGFVTYKSQTAAVAAIRAFNDSDKFDFKVSYSKGDGNPKRNERSQRGGNQNSNSRNYNDSDPPQKSNRETFSTIKEPDFDFHPPYTKTVTDQNIDYRRSRDNTQSHHHPSSVASVSTSSSNVLNRNVAEEMETKTVNVEKEAENKPTRRACIKPGQCCHCRKITFNVCVECRKSFCLAECSLNGWKNHTNLNCITLAALVPDSSTNMKNTSFDNELDTTLPNDSQLKYASDYSSPATEYKNFANLAEDYRASGNRSIEDASLQLPKFHTVCDNNYDDNNLTDTSFESSQQQQPSRSQHRTPRQYNKPNGTNDHERCSSRNYRQRDGGEDHDRGSNSGKNHNGDSGRDRRYHDHKEGASDLERNGGGSSGKNYSRDSNRDARSGYDRKKNLNEYRSKQYTDTVDNACNIKNNTKPFHGGRESEKKNGLSSSDFDGESKLQCDYQRRNNAQSRIDRIANKVDEDKNNSVEFTPQAHSSVVENKDRDSQKLNSQSTNQKSFEPNEITQVTIIWVDKRKDNLCFVRLADNEEVYNRMFNSLQKFVLKPLEQYTLKMKCVAKYKNHWHRAFITAEQPLRVYLIDFGISSEIEQQHLRAIPDQFLSYRPFVEKIRFPDVTDAQLIKWLNENTLISIKASSISADKLSYIANVITLDEELTEMRKEINAKPSIILTTAVESATAPTSSITPTNIVESATAPMPSITPTTAVEPKSEDNSAQSPALQSGKPVDVLVTYIENTTEFFVTFAEPFTKLSTKIAKKDINALLPLVEVQEGVLVFAEFCGDWCRAQIVSTDPLKISFIDFGNVEKIDAKGLKILPSDFAKIPPLAIRVKLHSGTVVDSKVVENDYIKLTPVNILDNVTWSVLVGDKSIECASLLKEMQSLSLSPSKSQPAAEPKPKVNVDMCILYAASKSEVYGIRKSDVEALDTLTNNLLALTDLSPVTTPVLDEIYVKQFEGIWCRARVTNISDSTVTIYFIDYGNCEECRKDSLFEPPNEFRTNPPPMAVKMILEKKSRKLFEYGTIVSVIWDMDKDTYNLVRDPTDPNAGTSSEDTNTTLVNVVTALGDSNYAVILEENRNVYKYINRQINANLDRLRKPKKIDLNDLCLAIYEDNDWHRAKIIRKSPLAVTFLDFANEMQCSFDQIKAIPSELAKIPPLAFKIKTEEYVELEEGSAVRITMIEELEHNYWKVATINETDRKSAGSKRVEIISDPKHIEKLVKKKSKASSSNITVAVAKEMHVIDDSKVNFMRTKIHQDNQKEVKIDSDASTERVLARSRSLVKPFDETSFVYTVLSNKPKNYNKNVDTLTNGVDSISLIEPKRNSTFSDINVPISKHLLDDLHEGDTCLLIVYDALCDDEYAGMLLCKRLQPAVDILDQLDETLDEAQSYNAKRGELVVIYVDGINTWQRAYVVYEPTNVDPFYLLILFDIGILYKTDQVFRLGEKFCHTPQLSVRINVTYFQPAPDDIARLEVLPINVNLFEGDTYQHDKSMYRVEVTSSKDGSFEGKLVSQFRKDNIMHTVRLSKWRPTREEIGVKHVPLMTSDPVKISSIYQTNQCYVIPADDAINEQRNDFLCKVWLHCKQVKPIERELKLKEIVGVHFMKSYYRAQVIERKTNSYMVRILDIGSEVKVLKNEVKPLPDHLKFADCYAVCIELHNVPCTDFNQTSENFLKYVVTHENELILEINESSHLIELIFNEEIEKLDIKKGASFNLRLNQLLVPLWKTEDLDFGARYYLMQLKFEEWTVGSELSLAFVESLDERSGFMINRYGDTYAKLIRVNLDERLKEYAEQVKDSYVPVRDELCVGKFDDKWCRAVCIDVEPGKDIELQFIDIGFRRKVLHTDIRRIHSDFLKHPAAALFCDVINYRDCKSLFDLQGKVLKKCRVVRKIEEGGYAIQVANLSAYS